MKRKHRDIYGWLLAGVLALVSLVTGIMALQRQPKEPVPVINEEIQVELGEKGAVTEITAAEFAQLVESKQSFVVAMHRTTCSAEFPLMAVAEEYAKSKNAILYALSEDEFKQTTLAETVKYLPSAAIYRDGELVKYLDAEKDEDSPYYKTVEGFGEWAES